MAFAVIRLADAVQTTRRASGRTPANDQPHEDPAGADAAATESVADQPRGLSPSVRQTVQVGIATSLAIVVGDLVSPTRWYWAVLTAFLVFAGTTSRGDVLTRGWH